MNHSIRIWLRGVWMKYCLLCRRTMREWGVCCWPIGQPFMMTVPSGSGAESARQQSRIASSPPTKTLVWRWKSQSTTTSRGWTQRPCLILPGARGDVALRIIAMETGTGTCLDCCWHLQWCIDVPLWTGIYCNSYLYNVYLGSLKIKLCALWRKRHSASQ